MERAGVVKIFPNSAAATMSDVSTALDISSKVDTTGEGGLLGMAFHPSWPSKKELYLSYTVTGTDPSTPLTSIISRVRSTDGSTFDPASEEVLLRLDQP